MIYSLLLLFSAMASIQFGATLSRSLFPLLGAVGATSWRLLLAASILMLIWRPWRISYSPDQRRGILLYGISLGFMNLCFYLALERIPLGIAVALEFTGPLTVALLGSKRPRDLFWALLAALGLGLILP
ncbi:MAG: EamA family transporter, partial [Bacteriovoracia bacterium]